jgi:hypothetical protein
MSVTGYTLAYENTVSTSSLVIQNDISISGISDCSFICEYLNVKTFPHTNISINNFDQTELYKYGLKLSENKFIQRYSF